MDSDERDEFDDDHPVPEFERYPRLSREDNELWIKLLLLIDSATECPDHPGMSRLSWTERVALSQAIMEEISDLGILIPRDNRWFLSVSAELN